MGSQQKGHQCRWTKALSKHQKGCKRPFVAWSRKESSTNANEQNCWMSIKEDRKGSLSRGVARKVTPTLMNGSLEWASERHKKLFVAWHRKKATPMLMNGRIEWPGRNGHTHSLQKVACKKLLTKYCLQKAAPSKIWMRLCGEIEYHCPERHNRDMLTGHGKEIESHKGQLKQCARCNRRLEWLQGQLNSTQRHHWKPNVRMVR